MMCMHNEEVTIRGCLRNMYKHVIAASNELLWCTAPATLSLRRVRSPEALADHAMALAVYTASARLCRTAC